MRIIFHIVFFLLIFQSVVAQELPLNSQVFINPYYYNPAYAGFEDRPAFYAYRRQQWTGIEGAPLTTGFNFHTIFNDKINFGIHIMNDERSILNTTRALVTFGYRASFDNNHYISFGLSGGLGSNTIDLDAIDPNDPAIIDAVDNNLFLDGNAGFNYFNQGFNLGLSLPKIFKTSTISNSDFAPSEISPLNDAIFLTSYRWEISEERFAIEPFGLYYYTEGQPGQYEVIGIVHLMDVFWIGGSYRQEYGTTGFIGLNIKDNFKFGYAYEFFTSQQANFDNGTHDIQLALIFGKKETKRKSKPKANLSMMQRRREMLRSMGKLPSEPGNNNQQVENDPFIPAPVAVETYSEDEALNDLLNEMADEETPPIESPTVEEFQEPEKEEDESPSIFDIQFDEEPNNKPAVAPVIAAVVAQSPEEAAEEEALNELLSEMADEENEIPEPVVIEEFEAPIEEDTIDIFDIRFDDDPENVPIVIAATIPKPAEEPKKFDEEESLISQLDDEGQDEITNLNQEGLTESADQVAEDIEEYIEPTLDDEGLYIGPTTVTKGNHLLELDRGNYVAVGTFNSYREAEEYSDAIFIKGFYTKFGYVSQTKIYYVYIFFSDDLQEANDTSDRFEAIGAQFRENWVLQVQ